MSSNLFIPTYLYIKQHTLTEKLYFGKTTKDPEKYLGSGLHWKNHIKKHGKEHVVTLWYCLFLDQESCTEFALNFSEKQNIVESDVWLNLQYENGFDGRPIGIEFTNEHKEKLSRAGVGKANHLGHTHSLESRMKMSKSKIGFHHSEESKLKMSKRIFSCEHREKLKAAQHKRRITEMMGL